MIKYLGTCCVAACGFLSAIAGPGQPNTLQLRVLPNARTNAYVSLQFLGKETGTEVKMFVNAGETVKPVEHRLQPMTQLLFINDEAYVVGAGDNLAIDLNFERMRVGGQAYQSFGRVANQKHILPRLIDSLYQPAMSAGTREAFDEIVTRGHAWLASAIDAAGVTPSERAMINAYEGYRKITYRHAFITAHPAFKKMPGFADWYFEGFDISDPSYEGFGSNVSLFDLSYRWYEGKRIADPSLPAEYHMTGLMSLARSERLKQEAARIWLMGEVRQNFFSPALKNAYPVLQRTLKPSIQKHYIDSMYARYAKMDRGLPAPNFKAQNAKGEIVRLSDYKGKMVVLDFWADWCSSCIANLPKYHGIADQYKGKDDVVFLTVAWQTKDTEAVWKRLSDQHHIAGKNNLVIYIDEKDEDYLNFYHGNCMTAVPRYQVIDKEGKFINNKLSVALDEKVQQQIADYYQEQQKK
ncbi:TlpA family protein disulfide reductase [Chitinophaga lutea]